MFLGLSWINAEGIHRGVLIFLGRIRVMKKGVEETCIDIQSESREWSLAHSDGLTLNH